MRTLIAGAGGQLGRALIGELRRAGHDVRPFLHRTLDVANVRQVRAAFEAVRPDIVINCSAYNRVDDAEGNRDLAFAVNAEGPGVLAAEAERLSAVFVHYSTDFVFDGETDRPYTEDDAPAPLNVYGQSKLAGEANATAASRHYILRLESLFGGRPAGGSTVDWLLESLVRGREAPVFVDRIVSPSYTADVANATRQILDSGAKPGLYHCVNAGHCAWDQLAQELARQMGVDACLRPVRVADAKVRALRPRFCALSSAKLAAAGIRMPTWQNALKRHLAANGFSVASVPAAVRRAPGAQLISTT